MTKDLEDNLLHEKQLSMLLLIKVTLLPLVL